METAKHHVKRVGIAIAGGLVVVVGIIAIPYPGPGWLIVFAGLAILATEFEWARRLLHRLRHTYGTWQTWLRNQHLIIRLLIIGVTGIIVILTMWLLNAFDLINILFHLDISWLHSPLSIFS
jgi:uncharacterized protein (TIGR02611 family)